MTGEVDINSIGHRALMHHSSPLIKTINVFKIQLIKLTCPKSRVLHFFFTSLYIMVYSEKLYFLTKEIIVSVHLMCVVFRSINEYYGLYTERTRRFCASLTSPCYQNWFTYG
uniref:Uncharacterized protein n=1 Tax=Schizaphis graminum TaxID=13262 RepID=A0A2S2PLZ4_SCHGA